MFCSCLFCLSFGFWESLLTVALIEVNKSDTLKLILFSIYHVGIFQLQQNQKRALVIQETMWLI